MTTLELMRMSQRGYLFMAMMEEQKKKEQKEKEQKGE